MESLDHLRPHKPRDGLVASWQPLVAKEKCALPDLSANICLRVLATPKTSLLLLWLLADCHGHSLHGGHCLVCKHWPTTE